MNITNIIYRKFLIYRIDSRIIIKAFFFASLMIIFSGSFATTYYTKATGSWASSSTWSTVACGSSTNSGTYPVAGDIVYICDGFTVTINANAACATLNIGGGTSGTLQFGTGSTYTLTVSGDITVNAGATFQSHQSSTSFGIQHTINLTGSLTNNGTVKLKYDSNDYAKLVFQGSGTSTVSGSGAWSSMAYMTLNKSTISDMVYITSTGFGTALSSGADALTTPQSQHKNPPVIFTSGTFRYNIADNLSNLIDAGATGDPTFTVPANVKIQVDQGIVDISTYSGIGTSGDVDLKGQLVVNGGTLTVSKNSSTTSNAGLSYDGTAAVLTINGGTVNCYGAFSTWNGSSDVVQFTMTGGTFGVNMSPTACEWSTFYVTNVAGSSVNFTGGTIVIQNKSTYAGSSTYSDFTLGGSSNGSYNVSGNATVQFGNIATPATQTMRFTADPNVVYPNVVVYNPGSSKVITLAPYNSADYKFLSLNINSSQVFDNLDIATSTDTHNMWVNGDFTNNGTFTARTGTVTFNGSNNSNITGSTTSFYNLTINKSSSSNYAYFNSVALRATNNVSVTAGTLQLGYTSGWSDIDANLLVSSGAYFNHTVEWNTYGVGLFVGGNMAIEGTYTYGSRAAIEMDANGVGGATKNMHATGISILLLINGNFYCDGNITVNDNLWAMYGSTGSFHTNAWTATANQGVYINGGTVYVDGGSLNAGSTGINVGYASLAGALNISTGTATCGSFYVGDGTRTGTATHSGGTLNVNGNLLINSSCSYTCSSTPAVNVSGNWTNNGTFTAGSSTVTCNGNSSQTIGGSTSTSFYNLSKNASGTTTQNLDVTVTNIMNISSGIWNAGTYQLMGTGGLTMSGGELQMAKISITLPQFTGAYALSGGTVTLNGTGSTQVLQSATYYNINKSGTSTVTFSGATMSITNNLTISAGILNVSTNTLSGAGGLTMSGGELQLAKLSTTIPELTGPYSITGGKVTLSGSGGSQVLRSATYFNLNQSGTSTVMLSGDVTVTNNLSISNGVLNASINSLSGAGGLTMTGGELQLAKTGVTVPELTGTYANSAGTVTFNAAGDQTIRGNSSLYLYNNVTINGSGTKTLGERINITGSVTISPGSKLTANNYTIVLYGNWINNGTFVPGTGLVWFIGNTDVSIGGATVPSNFYNVAITITTHTMNFNCSIALDNFLSLQSGTIRSNDHDITLGGNWVNYTTFIPGSCTVYMNGSGLNNFIGGSVVTTFYNLTKSGTGTILQTLDANVTNNMTVSAGTFNVDTCQLLGTASLTMTGGELRFARIKNSPTLPQFTGTYSLTGGTVTLSGNGGSQVLQSGISYYNVNKSSSGTVILSGTTTTITNNLAISNGIFNVSTNTLSGSGGLSMTGGELQLSKTGATVPELTGAYANTGGTVTFNGAGDQTIRGNGTYYDVTVNGSGTKTLSNSVTLAGTMLINAVTLASGNNNLTLSGDWTNNGSFSPGTGTVTFSGTNTQTIGGSSITNFYNIGVNKASNALDLSFNTVLGGSLTISSGSLASNNFDITLAGDWTNNGTFIAGTSTVTFNGTSAEAIAGTATTNFYNLIKNASGTTTQSQDITVTNALNISSGILNAGTYQLAGAGALTMSGGELQLARTTGSPTLPQLTGTYTLTGGTVRPNGSGGTQVLRSGIAYYNVNISGSSTVIFSGTSITVNNNLNISSGILNISTNTLSGAGGLTMSGGELQLAKLNATVPELTGTYSITGGTVSFNGAGDQTIRGNTIYYNLTVDGSGTKSMVNDLTLGGSLLINAGTLASNNHDITLAGDWINNGTFIKSNAAVIFNGGISQTIGGSALTTFNNLMILKSANDAALNQNIVVNGSVLISSGTLTGNSYDINLDGNWTNNGNFNPGTGTVTINGSSTQTINGTVSTAFYNIDLENATKLNVNTISTGTLTMNDTINLNSNTLTLGTSTASTGTLVYSSGIMYGGTFTRWFASTAIAEGSDNGLFPMGSSLNDDRPFRVSYPAGISAGGSISLTHIPTTGASYVSITDGGSTVIQRHNAYWTSSISGFAGVSGTPFNIKAGGTGFGDITNVNDLRLTRISDVVGTAGINTGTNAEPIVQRTGLSLSQLVNNFYIGTTNVGSSPLPIELLNFNATTDNKVVTLSWSTASENNNDFFTVERSRYGDVFEELVKIAGSGNSNHVVNYSAVDEHPYYGTSYYRLKQTDFNGLSRYFNIVTVHLGNEWNFQLYPNPLRGSFLYINYPKELSGKEITIKIYNDHGMTFYSNVFAGNNSNMLTLSMGKRLAAGTYIIVITSESSIYKGILIAF